MYTAITIHALSYSAIVTYNNKLYFNSPNKVFEFDPATNTATEIYEYTDEPNVSETYLYGLAVKGTKLCAEYSTNPNSGVNELITIINDPTISYSSNITKNDNGTYTISVTPNIETDDTPILYVAEYDGERQLIGIKLGENQNVDGKLIITAESPKTDNFKLMLWDKTNNPIINAISDIH